MSINQRGNSDRLNLSTPPQQIRSPASGYSKSILSAIKDIPYEQTLDRQQQNKITFQIGMGETKQMEEKPLDIPSPEANTKQHEQKRPSSSSYQRRQERRSISCDNTITSVPNTTIAKVNSVFQQRAQSVNITNVTSASKLLLPGCSNNSSKMGSCISLQSAASTSATTPIVDVDGSRKRSPSITSSICSKDEKSINSQPGQPKINFSVWVQALDACANGELKTLKKIIKENPDLPSYQYQYCYRYSCLHIAAKAGNIEIINFLVMNGANLNAKDDTWSTPLHLCAQAGHFDVVKHLKRLGAKTNIRDAYGKLYSSYIPNQSAVIISKKSATIGRQMSDLDSEQGIDSRDESCSTFSQHSLNANSSNKQHNYSFHSFRKPLSRAVHGFLHKK